MFTKQPLDPATVTFAGEFRIRPLRWMIAVHTSPQLLQLYRLRQLKGSSLTGACSPASATPPALADTSMPLAIKAVKLILMNEQLLTVAERSGFVRTGRSDEVERLCTAFAHTWPQNVRCFEY